MKIMMRTRQKGKGL